MRKYSGVLLALMVLHAIGYYPCLLLIKDRLSRNAQEKIDRNTHDISGNMIIRVPLSLPYPILSNEYQPVSGEITYRTPFIDFSNKEFTMTRFTWCAFATIIRQKPETRL